MSKLKFILCFAFLVLFSCSDDRRSSPDPWAFDCTPPAAISDLSVVPGSSPGTLDLSWTAPGDDTFSGYAQSYIVKYSTMSFNESNFNAATTYLQSWPPANLGQLEVKTLTGFLGGTTYYFAIKAQDEVPNTSDISNISSSSAAAGLQAIGWIGGNTSTWQQIDGASSSFGGYGFDSPRGVTVDSSGNIYVADTYNHRICKWSSLGTTPEWIGGGQDGWQASAAPLAGNDYQSFNHPWDVCLDSLGNIYVSDTFPKRISKWDKDGNALGWIGHGQDGWQTVDATTSGQTAFKYFNSPHGLFVDSFGNIFIADSASACVHKWDSLGVAQGWIGCNQDGWQTGLPGSSVTGLKGFRAPYAVELDSSGNIYVADYGAHRVCKWSSTGTAIGWFGHGQDGWQTVPAFTTGGSDYQSFDGPVALCLDSTGNIYVLDHRNNRVCKWDSAGIAVGWFGGGQNAWQTGTAPSYGNDYQSFDSAFGLHLASGNFFIADQFNHRISKWHE